MRGQGPNFAASCSVAAIVAMCAAPGAARGSGLILVEATGEPSGPSLAASLAALRSELGAHGVVTDARAVAELDNELLPMPGRWDEPLTLAELTARLDAGVYSYLRGNFRMAAQQLDAALAVAWRNPALVVADSTCSLWMTQALVSLALARARLGQHDLAAGALAEQIRSFPELPVTRAAFGSRGDELYARTRRALEARARGGLLVDIDDPDARIYVNEVGRGHAGAFASDVLPGAYRVLVMVRDLARTYRVRVHPNEQTRLRVEWKADAALIVADGRVAIELGAASPVERDRALRRLAGRLQFHDVIVVGSRGTDAGPALWGRVLQRRTGKRLRESVLSFGANGPAPSAAELSHFAAFLAAGDYAHVARSARVRIAVELGDAEAARTAASGPVLGARPAERAGARPWPPRRDVAKLVGIGLIGAGATTASAAAVTAATRLGGICTPSCRGDPGGLAWVAALVTTGLVSCGVGAVLVADAGRASASRPSVAISPLVQPMDRHAFIGALAQIWWQF